MNRSNTGFRILSAALALALGAGLYAQNSLDTGSIKGRVTDDKGGPLPGAVIKAKGTQGSKGAETDSSGNYVIPFLTSGTYELTATMDGFATVVQSGVAVNTLSVTQQSFKLQPGSEVINVTASAVHIDPTSASSKTTINLGDAVKHFAQGNSLTSAFDFAPGTNTASGTPGAGNVSISGASGFENQYLVGGVNITNAGYGGIGAFDRFAGITGTGMTSEFLTDLNIREGGFEAEYGQALGGVISASVKQGTNELHSAVNLFYQPRSLDGERRNLSDYYPGGFTNNHGTNTFDAAFDIGGPIIKDKLFYFVGYNPVWTRDFRKFSVSDTAAIANDGIRGGAPYINNEYQFAPVRVDNYAAHLTWNLSDKHKLDFLLFGSPVNSSGIQSGVGLRVGTTQDPGVATSPTSPPARGTIEDVSALRGASGTAKSSDVSYSLKYYGTLAPWFNLEAQVAFHKIKTSLRPDYLGLSYTDIRRSQYFTAATNAGIQPVMSSNQYQFGSTFGYSTGTLDQNTTYTLKATNTFNAAGAHDLKYGFEYADIKYAEANQFGPPIMIGPYLVTSGLGGVTFRCTSVNPAATGIGNACNGAPVYRSTRTRLNPIGLETRNKEQSLFLQDKWTIRSVTLSLGARLTSEKVSNPNDFTILIPVAGVPTRRTFYGSSYTFQNEVAPRLGITWDVMGNGKSKLYASFGRMFERIPNDLAVRSFGNEASLARVTSTTPDFSTATIPTRGGIFSPTCVAGAAIDPIKDPDNYATFGSVCGGPGTAKTRLPYKDETILGYQFQFSPTVLVDIRGMYRKQGRLLEDTQPVTVEATENYYAAIGVLGTCAGGPAAGCPVNPAMPFPGFGSAPFGGYVLANVGENAPTYFYDAFTGQKITVGYGSPRNKYKSLAITVMKEKEVGGHVSMVGSYRISKLQGNYEGLYRNDNGQSDPNISSLYDFPESPLLAGQFISGPLNTDTPHSLRLRFGYDDLLIKNFSAAVSFKWESGIPRTPYLAHPNFLYNNAGEVPGINPVYYRYSRGNIVANYTPVQRGFQGRTPDIALWDVKFGYDWNLGKSSLNFSVLVNNIFNDISVTRWNQNVENSAGVLNPNYGKPTISNNPRTIRLGARWSF